MSDAVLKALTDGTAEFILSLPESERLKAWRTFLSYVAVVKA